MDWCGFDGVLCGFDSVRSRRVISLSFSLSGIMMMAGVSILSLIYGGATGFTLTTPFGGVMKSMFYVLFMFGKLNLI